MKYKIQELSLVDGDKYIFGQLYLPDDERKEYPTVILCHGYGVNHMALADFAELLAEAGIAAYTFDFCGGGYGCKSSGSMLEMSVLTELSDLEFVLQNIYDMGFADKKRIYLCGESQGGLICTLCGAKRESMLAGLVLLYPAFSIPEFVKKQFPDADKIPDKVITLGKTVGRKYYIDARNIAPYDQIASFHKRILIFHGDKDELLPLSSSRKAEKVCKNAKLVVVPGAIHGFYDEEVPQVARQMIPFLMEG